MNTVFVEGSTWPRLRSIMSAAAVVLALYAALSFTHLNVIWDPAYYGEFGLTVTSAAGPFVDSIVPGSAADNAGIKLGDRVDRPQALRDRLALTEFIAPRPGERMTINVLRGNQGRTLTLTARPLARLTTTDSLLLFLKHISMFVLLVVGLILVLLRPSKMTWGFYLVALSMVLILGDDRFFSGTALGLLVQIIDRIILPAGAIGFLIFCVRFPHNATTGWRKVIDSLAPYLLVALVALFATQNILHVAFIWPAELLRFADYAVPAVVLACFTAGTSSLLITYSSARGLERQRLNWVVLGGLCALIATAGDVITIPLSGEVAIQSAWLRALDLLYVALPLAVAYAVIRYRVIHVRFVASRALAVGAIASTAALVFVGIDWLFSTRLPSSHLEAAAYAGVALLVGFSLNAARQRIGKTIDSIFFHQWHQTQQQAELIADALRRATSIADLYEPLTADLARVFSLASTALFERVEGAGFVRVAAFAWPVGTLWHILLHDPPVLRLNETQRVTEIDTLQWQGRGIPAGVARPTIMLPIMAGRRVPAMLLCGAHENGTGLDPDERRSIRRLCSDASLVYSRSPGEEFGRTTVFDQQREPLGA